MKKCGEKEDTFKMVLRLQRYRDVGSCNHDECACGESLKSPTGQPNTNMNLILKQIHYVLH